MVVSSATTATMINMIAHVGKPPLLSSDGCVPGDGTDGGTVDGTGDGTCDGTCDGDGVPDA